MSEQNRTFHRSQAGWLMTVFAVAVMSVVIWETFLDTEQAAHAQRPTAKELIYRGSTNEKIIERLTASNKLLESVSNEQQKTNAQLKQLSDLIESGKVEVITRPKK
jgi:hypothetical protein